MGNSVPLPHIQEQQDPSPFNRAPSDVGTQVRGHYLLLLPGWLCLQCVPCRTTRVFHMICLRSSAGCVGQ